MENTKEEQEKSERLFTEAELVEFGRYLLSDNRIKNIVSIWSPNDETSLTDRLKEVYEADVIAFKAATSVPVA